MTPLLCVCVCSVSPQEISYCSLDNCLGQTRLPLSLSLSGKTLQHTAKVNVPSYNHLAHTIYIRVLLNFCLIVRWWKTCVSRVNGETIVVVYMTQKVIIYLKKKFNICIIIIYVFSFVFIIALARLLVYTFIKGWRGQKHKTSSSVQGAIQRKQRRIKCMRCVILEKKKKNKASLWGKNKLQLYYRNGSSVVWSSYTAIY